MMNLAHIGMDHFTGDEQYILIPYFEYFYCHHLKFWNELKEALPHAQIAVGKEIIANAFEIVINGSKSREEVDKKLDRFVQKLSIISKLPLQSETEALLNKFNKFKESRS